MTGVIAALAGAGRFSVSVSPDSASGFGSTLSITTNSVTASASEPGSYTYSWVLLASDGVVAVNSPASATTTFTGSLMTPGEFRTAIFACDVTKAGVTVRSPEVAAQVERAT